jgi:hypothetical protein
MMRRDFLRSLQGYGTALDYAQDYDLWLRASGKGMRIANIPMPLLFYRVHPKSISSARMSRQIESAAEILQRHLKKQLGIDLDIGLVRASMLIPKYRIPMADLMRLIPFYLRLARQCLRDSTATKGDFLFFLRRIGSRIIRSLGGARLPTPSEAGR